MDVVVDLAERDTGWLRVSATWNGLDRRDMRFRQMGAEGEHTYAEVEFSAEGRPLEATFEAPFWAIVDPPEAGPISASWRAKPGGMGRHGHQGFVASDWTSFDGRVLLLPQGRRSLQKARIRIEAPEGWSVVHPYRVEDDWMVVEGSTTLKKEITATCVAVGDYDIRSQEFGDTEVRVGALASWPDAHRETLFEKTFTTFGWFQATLGFDREAPFAIAWLPSPEGQKVFGGASVNGACYEHEEETARNWLLLGHRIAHPMNKYVPAGMTLRDRADHWFMEGWASYIEVVGAAGSGALPDERHWNTIYRRHLRDTSKNPEHDIALRDELEHPEAYEYVHYTKGPLVVKHLDTLMRQRSGTTLEAFMRAMWPRYGFHRDAFPLREELEAFTGDDYDDFWAVFVDRPGHLYPVWPEMIDGTLQKRMQDPPAAHVGDVPIHGEYLFWLAWSGRFERYADIEAFLVESVHRQRVLASRGLELLPVSVRDFQYALPAQSQEAIARVALDWPLEAVPARSGCGGGDPAASGITWSDSADGQTFARLLELERDYEASLGSMIGAIDVRVPQTPTRKRTRLGVSPGEPFVLHTAWVGTPPRAGIELHVGDQRVKAKQLTLDPSWINTRVRFDPRDRPASASILLLKVGPDLHPVSTFPLWQRPAPFARGKRDQDPR